VKGLQRYYRHSAPCPHGLVTAKKNSGESGSLPSTNLENISLELHALRKFFPASGPKENSGKRFLAADRRPKRNGNSASPTFKLERGFWRSTSALLRRVSFPRPTQKHAAVGFVGPPMTKRTRRSASSPRIVLDTFLKDLSLEYPSAGQTAIERTEGLRQTNWFAQ